MKTHYDTIAAVATPPGEGGLAVIRVSGPEAITIVARRFSGRVSLTGAASHTAHVGELCNAAGVAIDQTVCTLFRAPHSYTGEEVVEVSCHGGVLVTRRVLESLIETGARHARPGEFTERAFLNGRIDLSQAEAVADLIHARSDLARHASLAQLRGSLFRVVESLRKRLLDSASLIELELDFIEEGYEFKDRSEFLRQIGEALGSIDGLLGSYRYGRIWREGVSVVIAGTPNVGKSSLLNALLNEERAIVTDIPGTTRDSIEESISIEGIQFRLTDTAGVRHTIDPVEREGVQRSRALIKNAEIVLFMLDNSRAISKEEEHWISEIRMERKRGEGLLFVLNKSDLLPVAHSLLNSEGDARVVHTSAKTGSGLAELKRLLVAQVSTVPLHPEDSSPVVTNSRHFDALVRAKEHLAHCLASLNENRSSEFVAVDLRLAIEDLGEIIGVVTSEDILNNIFSRFCIGK
jgi:tRNA modification GTPase